MSNWGALLVGEKLGSPRHRKKLNFSSCAILVYVAWKLTRGEWAGVTKLTQANLRVVISVEKGVFIPKYR